jgi:peptidoglycan-associated lipoprotein
MKRPVRSSLLLLLCGMTVALCLSGCPKRPVTSTASPPAPTLPPALPPTAPTPPARPPAAAAAPPAPPSVTPGPTAPAPATPPKPCAYAADDALKDIYFAFDKADIRPVEVKTLEANGTWLKRHDNSLVLIEGHCDERGTPEYNLALGQRRATSAMNYLVSRGIPASRITVVSYGKERPVCTEHTHACWARNRRAHFLVKER